MVLSANRWADKSYTKTVGIAKAVPGVGYNVVGTGASQTVYVESFSVTPGESVWFGFTKKTIRGTATTAQKTGLRYRWKIPTGSTQTAVIEVGGDVAWEDAGWLVPEGVTQVDVGLYTTSTVPSTVTVQFSNIVVSGGLSSSLKKNPNGYITIDNDSNIIDYSVQEDATPLNFLSGGGGFGQLSYSRTEMEDDERLIEDTTVLHDDRWGDFSGTIRDLNASDGLINITADSVLSSFDRWYTVPPYNGNLQGYLGMLSSIVGESIYSDAVRNNLVVPGFLGNVWDGFRNFLIANKLEVSQVGTKIVVRELRTFDSHDNYNTTESWNINSQETTEKLKVYWRDIQRQGSSIEIYAPDTEFSVDAKETVVQEISIEGSISSVNQPTCLYYVPANTDYSGTSGVYCVSDNTGHPVPPEKWLDLGGSVQVEMTDDPSIIRLTITGCSDETYSPYRIAATAGSSSYYNSLHLTGTGLFWEKKSVEIYTGAPRATNAQETAQEIDDINITSLSKAYEVAMAATRECVGSIKSITGTSVSLNRPSDRSASVAPLILDFNAKHSGLKISGFNTYYAGNTFKQFNTAWTDTLAESLANQAFGQVIGARATRDGSMYRIQSVTTNPSNMQYTLEMDTLISDFNSTYGTMPIGMFNTLLGYYEFKDFNNRSLSFGNS